MRQSGDDGRAFRDVLRQLRNNALTKEGWQLLDTRVRPTKELPFAIMIEFDKYTGPAFQGYSFVSTLQEPPEVPLRRLGVYEIYVSFKASLRYHGI